MEEKISIKAVEQYSEAFAAKVAETVFANKQSITGPEILNVTELKQVNLFILRELMVSWKDGMEKSKSPYFDYSAAEVQESFRQFQNIVSNHIAVRKREFLLLMAKAVSKTILLILDPYDFYSDVLDRPGKIKTVDLIEEVKYVKINRAPLERLLESIKLEVLDEINGNTAFAKLDHILEEVNFAPEEIDPFVAQFSKVLPLNLVKMYEAPIALVGKQTIKVNAPKQPVAEVVVKVDTELPKQKQQRIKDTLTINQKFMFTKILFHGDFEIFTVAIEKLDQFDNLEQALRFLQDQYPEWDRETEEYEEFLMLLERRFA